MRVIALGGAMAGDDGAALEAARRLADEPGLEVIFAGRPGIGLIDLLDAEVPTILIDVVRGSGERIVAVPLARLRAAAVDHRPASSHGVGVKQALDLAHELGRPLPRGVFLGIEGSRFAPATAPGTEVTAAIGELVRAVRSAAIALREEDE